jgi:hypothetical protein
MDGKRRRFWFLARILGSILLILVVAMPAWTAAEENASAAPKSASKKEPDGENRSLEILKGERPLYEPESCPPDSLTEAILCGQPILKFRYRFENVEQGRFDRDAKASTLRVELGYETERFYGLSALLSFQGVVSIGPEEYNSTVNGKSEFPIVADPETFQLHQGSLAYDGLPATNARAGRQRINLDNQRFVGTVAFRQIEQTFDSARVINESLPHTRATYAYVWQVNRVLGIDSPLGEFDTGVHLFNAAYQGFEAGVLVGYAYLLDIKNLAPLSTNTFGFRFTGEYPSESGHDFKFIYTAEYARQTDAADNPNRFDLNYAHLVPGFSWSGFRGMIGWEYLEGNGVNALQTPLATLHKFNGWTDRFLVTPPDGLEDRYLSLGYLIQKVPYIRGTTLLAVFHDFRATETDAKYGTEWDFKISKTIFRRYTLSAEYADYRAEDFATDTRRLWLTLQIVF